MKRKEKLLIVLLIFLMVVLLTCSRVLANDNTSVIAPFEYSEEFKKYMQLSDEEKSKIIEPRMYDILKTDIETKNPLRLLRMVAQSLETRYSLKDTIPNNVVIKNQMKTNSCWTFATLSSLETNLALTYDKSKVYDFSERHMNYATSRIFKNNVVNQNGFDRTAKEGGTIGMARVYLTNGMGAIDEEQMKFENNSDTIDISEIQNKKVTSEVYDTISFSSYNATDDTTEIREKMKNHIKNYGAIVANIYGTPLKSEYYNNSTGAVYCDDTEKCKVDHAVSIVGWDDDYPIENFNEAHRPKNKGAWIIKNSWGTKKEYTLDEMKENIFSSKNDECIDNGWSEPSQIPDDYAKQEYQKEGYTIENDKATLKIGDNGFWYISYEDVNIYSHLFGIKKATNEVDYENIYLYDNFGTVATLNFKTSNKIYMGNIFDKKTSNTEYLTKVALDAPEAYTCKVYVNAGGTSMAASDLKQVELKTGSTASLEAGYHTLEFLKPVEITGNSFAVVIEIEGTRTDALKVSIELNVENSIYDVVTTETGKCFYTTEEEFNNNRWKDLSKLPEIDSSYKASDSSIKAFTVSEIPDNSLRDIQITTPPTKTAYFEGENFDKTGMVVTANYNNGKSLVITDYNITNGTNLKEGQANVTITYEDKTVTQAITVEKNVVTGLRIATPPDKTAYKAGNNFDKTGMVVQAVYKDGTVKNITDYTVLDGTALKNGQTTVTISYDNKTVTQEITVEPNLVENIQIVTPPKKTKYVVGQNFDKTGMVVKAIYEDGTETNITNYVIENGENLTKDQTSVTIKFENKTVTQEITVEEKQITSISVSKKPTKILYTQNVDDLDLTGGTIKVIYNDNTSEEIPMNSENVTATGFSNEEIGKVSITLTYQEKTTEFEVEVVAEEEQKKPENSNFDSAKCDIKTIKYYTFSDNSEKEYTLMEVEVNGISRKTDSEKYEYYYYLSPNQSENNIEDWVKITEEQTDDGKLKFTINTNDIKEYKQISNSDTLYLYVKEVATQGGNQSVLVSKSMKMEKGDSTVTYVNNGKVTISNSSNSGTGSTQNSNSQNNNLDNMTKLSRLPNAGRNTLIVLVVIISILGIVGYIKYKNLSKYVK